MLITLKNKLCEINNFINDKENVIYLDYPFHFNIGDSLIFHGTLDFFKENNIKPKLFLCTDNFSIEKIKNKIDSETTIFLHGGGNFGDLYNIHQNLREIVIENFPNNKIIMLPQSVYFQSPENLKKSLIIFKKHKNLILFARDSVSLEILSSFSDKSYLMPDMAHQLYQKLPTQVKKKDKTLYFIRKDKEQISQQNGILDILKAQHIDWDDLITTSDIKIKKKISKKMKSQLLPFIDYDKNAYNMWAQQTEMIIKRVCEYYLEYDHIVTSRLHSHILSSLLHIPSTIIDNNYQKNSLYYKQWTSNLSIHNLYQ